MGEELPAGGTVRCAFCNTDGVSFTADKFTRIYPEYPSDTLDLCAVEADGDVDGYSAVLMRGPVRSEYSKLDRVVAVLKDLAARGMVTRGRGRAVGIVFMLAHPAVIPEDYTTCVSRYVTEPGMVGGPFCEFLRMLLAPEDLEDANGSLFIGISIVPRGGMNWPTWVPDITPAEMENLLDHMRESDGNIKPAGVHLSRETDREDPRE